MPRQNRIKSYLLWPPDEWNGVNEGMSLAINTVIKLLKSRWWNSELQC